MTREEGKEFANALKNNYTIDFDKLPDFCDLVISALSAEPCEDCISRTEVIKAIDEREDVNGKVDAEDIRTDICLIPSKSDKGEWIPVSERLPEKDMLCLVAVGLLNLTQLAMYSDLMGVIDHRIFYQGDVGHDSFEDITEYVKAWIPLPEPYKKEGE